MRIKLDLSDFLEDERKFSVLKVKPKETKTVRDVISKISHLFSVFGEEGEKAEDGQDRPRLGLFEEEFYIHPDETAAVLEDSGVLKLKLLPGPGTQGKKKKKSKKDSVQIVVEEDGEEIKKIPRRGKEETEKKDVGLQEARKKDKMANQVLSEEVTEPGRLGEEEPKKTSKKRKRCQFAEEVEELQGRKRSKMVKLEFSPEESREEEQHLKERRKQKKKADRERFIMDTSVEKLKGKKQQHSSKLVCDSLGSHKKGQHRVPSTEESWEAPEPLPRDRKKNRLEYNGGGSSSSSQDKVVSTSRFLTTLDGSTSSNSSDLDVEVNDKKPCVADSVIDPVVSHGEGQEVQREEMPTNRRKRKRKHRKKEETLQADPRTTAQPSAGKVAANAWSSGAGQSVAWGKVTPVASFPNTHIVFNSDEDGEGLVASQTGPDKLCHQNKKAQSSNTATPNQHNHSLATPRPAITGRVRDISKERRPPATPLSPSSQRVRTGSQCSPLHQNAEVEMGDTLYPEKHTPPYTESGRGLVQRRSAHNLEELATLRKICENNTITICKVDSRRDQPKPKEESKPPSPSPPSHRAPPSPPLSSSLVVHDSRHSGALQALAAMKNRSTPVVLSGVRAVGVRPIQRHSGAGTPARPPITNGSPGPAGRNTTSLPADDPLQLLSSNLSEIQQQYNQDCEQTRAARRPAALHSLGAVLSGMRVRAEGNVMDRSALGHSTEKPRTFPSSGSKMDSSNQGPSDLLVLDCDETDDRVAVSPRKKEGLPDIYCVSPSSPSRPPQKASPSKPPQEASPSKPPQQASPSKPPQQASSSKPPQQASSSKPPQQASSSRPPRQTIPSRPPRQASPSMPGPQAGLSRQVSRAISLRPLLQTNSPRPQHHVSPSVPIQQATSFRAMQQAAPFRPVQQSTTFRSVQQAVPFRPGQSIRPQCAAMIPAPPKWHGDEEIVDLEVEDQPEVVTCDRGDDKADDVTAASPLSPPVTATECRKLSGMAERSKVQDAAVMEYAGNGRGTSPPPRDLEIPSRPLPVTIRPMEGGMSTGQYIAEILEDCEMLSTSGGVKSNAADTQTKVVPARVDCVEAVDDDEEEEVVLEEDEVMLEEDGDGEEEEEGEDEEEDEDEEEEEGDDDEEEEIIEEVQDEEETDLYANIDEEEEEEEDDHNQSDFDYEIIEERSTSVPTSVRRQEAQSMTPESAKGSAEVVNLNTDTSLRVQPGTISPTGSPQKESNMTPNMSQKILENGGETTPVKTINPVVAVPQEVMPIMTLPQEATPIVTIPPEVTPATTESLQAVPVTAAPTMTESQEVTPAIPTSPEVTAIVTGPEEVTTDSTEPEVIPVMTQSSEVKPKKTQSSAVTAVMAKSPEVTLVSKSQETASSSSSCKLPEGSEGKKSKKDEPTFSVSHSSTTTTTATTTTTTTTTEEAKKVLLQTLKEDMVKDITSPKSNPGQSSNDSFNAYPLMTAPPKAGDFIALKVLVLDKCYSIAFSDYKMAKVVAVDGVYVKLKFIEGDNLQAALEAEDLTRGDIEEDSQLKVMDWRDIMEPRHVFSIV